MSSPTPAPAPALCQGAAIEYRAFARHFYPNQDAAVLLLIATCSYPSGGWSISFQETANGAFQLMEHRPTHPVPQLVSYYSATWSSGQQMENVPKHVTITDGAGKHQVAVKGW